MEQEIDLRELLGILLKRWWIIVIIFILAVAASAYYTHYFLTPTYEASTKMLVGRIAQQEADELDKAGEAGTGEVQLQSELVGTYEQITTSNPVMEDVTLQPQHLHHDISDLQSKVSVSQVGDTELISIDVTDEDPEYAAELSITVTEIFQDHVMELLNVDNVNIVDPAIVPESPISPRPRLNMALAGVLGLMIGVFLVFFLEFLDNTVKTTEDIEKELGLPVLASIPNYEAMEKRSMFRRAKKEKTKKSKKHKKTIEPVAGESNPGESNPGGTKTSEIKSGETNPAKIELEPGETGYQESETEEDRVEKKGESN